MKIVNGADSLQYPVTAIFRSIQGEGHFVGYPMTFLRLAGCSVKDCSIRKECDEAPWKAVGKFSLPELRRIVAGDLLIDGPQGPPALYRTWPGDIVCITGGEPTDHNLVPLLAALRDTGYRVHLETSGVRSVMGLPFEWITVSPKTPDYVQRIGHTLKVVVRPGMGWDEVEKLDEGTQFLHRYLQPMWWTESVEHGERGPRGGESYPEPRTNLDEVVKLLLDKRNVGARWALSTQAHKTWRMP